MAGRPHPIPPQVHPTCTPAPQASTRSAGVLPVFCRCSAAVLPGRLLLSRGRLPPASPSQVPAEGQRRRYAPAGTLASLACVCLFFCARGARRCASRLLAMRQRDARFFLLAFFFPHFFLARFSPFSSFFPWTARARGPRWHVVRNVRTRARALAASLHVSSLAFLRPSLDVFSFSSSFSCNCAAQTLTLLPRPLPRPRASRAAQPCRSS